MAATSTESEWIADQAQATTQESGGGEGAAAPPANPPQTVEVVKPIEAVAPQTEAKPDQQTEAKQATPETTPPAPIESASTVDNKPVDVSPAVETIPVEAAPPTEIKSAEATPASAESTPVEAPVTAAVNKPDESMQVDAQPTSNGVAETSKNGDWQQREAELLKKIEELEKVKNERTEDGFKLELKVREEEIDLLKARVKNLETELQAALSKPSGKNHEMIENIKQQHEELLSKARGMIFDKTKMVKNQELQIEALTTQVQSLKDINLITKDLLEIRNSEIKAMEDRLQAMEARFKAEKDKYSLVLQRAQTSTTLNDDLKKEYETQLAIFKELRLKYEQRVQALVAENAKLKEVKEAKEVRDALAGGKSG